MGMTFLQKIQDLTKTSEEKKHKDLRVKLTQNLMDSIEAAARAGKSSVRYCNFYDRYPEPDEKQDDYEEVLEHFQKEGFTVSMLLKAETFIYVIDWS